MKAGFIGLGTLGRTMAERLISEGVELTVWNRTGIKAEGLKATIVESPAQVFESAEVIFLNLFDSDAVHDVITGRGGLLECDEAKDRVIIDTTTNHPSSALLFHGLLEEYGSKYLDSPVLGSIVPASKGMLTVVSSGDKIAYERALPFIKKIGSTFFHFDEPALASKLKLINNMLLGSIMSAIAEGLAIAEDCGVTKEQALDVLGAGAGKSLVMDAKRQKLLDEDFSNHFSSAAIYKDLHYLQDLARELKRPLITGSAAKEAFAMTFALGIADEDFSGIYKVFKSFSDNS